MKTVEDYEQIRKAFFVEGQSIRAIHRELQVDRETIRKAIVQAGASALPVEPGSSGSGVGTLQKAHPGTAGRE